MVMVVTGFGDQVYIYPCEVLLSGLLASLWLVFEISHSILILILFTVYGTYSSALLYENAYNNNISGERVTFCGLKF